MPRTARAVRTTPARDPIVGLFRRGWSLPLLESARLNAAVCRVAFRGAGLRSGILRALAEHSATGVFDRHLPPAEVGHLGPEVGVPGMQR